MTQVGNPPFRLTWRPFTVSAVGKKKTGRCNDTGSLHSPAITHTIQRDTVAAGFSLASESQTESWLRTLAAKKIVGAFLELGTSTGLSTAWILAG